MYVGHCTLFRSVTNFCLVGYSGISYLYWSLEGIHCLKLITVIINSMWDLSHLERLDNAVFHTLVNPTFFLFKQAFDRV